MSGMDEIANTITYLCMAKDCAVKAGMDYHFLSEIDHLIATAKSNMEEEK